MNEIRNICATDKKIQLLLCGTKADMRTSSSGKQMIALGHPGILTHEQGNAMAGVSGFQSYIDTSAFDQSQKQIKDFLHTIVKVTGGANPKLSGNAPNVDETANPQGC